ncbi:hypothetical protein LAZ67_20002015 [Cordylochernes scorpioides]|uniref:Retrovirus-related Pol polyprotein from type-1 retrotransposable element R1 n=1 Tax=Cordylochernes scorpioides TaxID=51811 RepID=A0ABY6LMT9_9ARAC|nr:hypothetical protein LAZ67_20002015 [Cordylochernes scorpioides]
MDKLAVVVALPGCGNPITHPLPRLSSTFHIGITTEPVKVDRITEDSSMQRMTEAGDEYVADALTNMQPHCDDLVGRLTDAIRGLAVPRAEEALISSFDGSHATSSLLPYSHLQRSTPASISHFKCGNPITHPLPRLPTATTPDKYADSFQEKPPKKTTAIFLDMTSAFDRVWREKLREKLHNIGSWIFPVGLEDHAIATPTLLRMHPSLLARFFNRCLDTGTFPEAWKVARVVLLEKSGRKGYSPNDYRPLSLLVCLGMVLDSLLAQRLKHWLESNELLSSFQHGFREGNSTTTALNEVLEGVEMGLNKGAWVLFVALDIDDPPFSENEVKLTAFKFGKRKSPGPEGIDNTVVKALLRMHPSLLARFFNRCLDTGTFPEAWKVARVVLLEKFGRKGYSPNDYRPLSLLVCLGMVLDSLLAQRLKHWLEGNELLSSFQHGFREGNSTTTALNEVLVGVEMGLNKGAWVLFVALDIDGAFNSMSWNKLMRNLMDMGCPDNLCSLVRDFLRDRRISLSFGGRKLERNCARGCPQGSCCGPILWNILVNTVFQEELPEGARLVLYADDQFLIIEAFNVSKTKALSFKPRDIRTKRKGIKWEHKPAIRMKGRRVVMGVVIDDKMGWQYQAEEMVARGREALCRPVLVGSQQGGEKEAGALEWKRDPRKPPQWLPKWNWSPGGPTGIGTVVFTDGSKSGTNTGAEVVIFTNGELIFQESLTLRVDELVFSAELVAIRVALRVCAEKNFSPDRLYSDCMSALVAINLVKGQLAHQIIQELEMTTRAPELYWVRRHSLIEGNEFADRLTKAGCFRDSSLRTPVTKKEVYRRIRGHVQDLWLDRWRNSVKGREEERRRARGAIESKLLRNHSKLLEKAHDVAAELFLSSMAAALQKIDIDPEQLLYTPKIVDIAAAVMEMHGDI